MNYKHLKYLWTVAKEGSIARASERLHITPQTISGQLSLLEESLSVELFVKTGRNIEMTETGRLGVADVVPKSIAQRILLPAL